MTIHDAHCHFFSERFFEALGRERKDLLPADPVGAVTTELGWARPGASDALADHWASHLDGHGVSRAALIASVPGDEESVAAAVAKHPDRFVGLFMLNPTQHDAEDRVRRGLTDLRLRGICLFPAMHRFRLDSPEAERVFGLAAELGARSVFVHCGVLSLGVRKKLGLPSRFDVRLGDPLALVPIAATYPDLPIVIPHFAAGFTREALMAADLSPNIHFDTSSSNSWIKYHPELNLLDVFRQALAVVGPDRLLFGTDSSFFPRGWQKPIFEAQEAILRALGVDEAAQTKIFSGNFDRVYGT